MVGAASYPPRAQKKRERATIKSSNVALSCTIGDQSHGDGSAPDRIWEIQTSAAFLPRHS